MYNGDPLFSGRIDDFRVYNYGLTGKEVYAAAATGGSNSAPSFAANPLARGNAAEDVAYSGQTLAGSATDANGGALAYSKVTGPSWLTVASNGALSGTPGNSDVGSNLFVVRVTDGSGATDDANLYIAVANANDAPTWGTASLARPDVTRGQPLVAYTVAGEASDVDAADTITYSKASGPSWLAVAADGTLSGTPSAGDVGANAFTVRVTDGAGAYSDATLTVNVLPYMLRSQYAFEDNTDDSAGGFNGAATGTPAYGLGRIGRGLVFDGTDDHVTLPAAAADYQDFTVAAWVYWTGGSAWQRIFDFGDDTTHYMFLTPKSETGLRFAINNGGTEEQVNCAAALPSGQWVHVAVTLGGNTAKLYLNGAAVATNSSITVHPGDFKPALNYIGKSHFADPLFGGTVDDFRIYNYATTAAEIAAMINIVPSVPLNVTVTPRAGRIDVAWNASQGATSYTVKRSTASGSGYTTIAAGITGGSYPDTSVANGMTYYYIITASNGQGESAASGEAGATASDLLAWLKFNETSGTAASDASGNGWNATLVNSPSWVSGIYAGGVRLTAASSQYLTLPSGIVSGLTDFTVSGWVNVSAFNTWQRIFDFGTGTTNYMFLTTQYTTTAPNSAKFRFAIRTPSVAEQQLSSSVAVGTNAWVHYAVTLSNTTAKLYINGAPVATNAATTLRPSSLGTTTLNYLGKSQWADPYLDGSLDDFRIHTRALSAAEIAAAAAPSPAAPQELLGAPGDGSVALNWSHENLTSSYSVKRAAARGGPYTTLATGLAGTAYTDTTASNGTTYFYVVTGSNAQGESASSPEAVVTPFQARFRPYSADANTPVLVHFAETAGGSAATNSGALGKNFYSVDLTNAASPVVVTTSIGNTAGYSGFGNAANITSAGCVLGWDANGNGTYNADVSSASLSADRTNMSALNIGNGGQSPWTVEAMVYCTLATLNTNQEILCTDSSATSRGFQFRISSAAELELNFINGTSSGTADIKTAVPTTGANAYAANAWFHVAATYDGTNARLYWTKVSPTNKAANLISTTAVGVGTSAGSLTGPLCVGNENRNNAGENLRGYVDEVRISSVCRSANDFYWQADPDAPTNLSSTAGDAQVALTWTAAAGAAGYYVKRSTAVGGPYAVIATSFGTSYTDLTAANGETYHYVVTAINGAGESSASPSSTASPVSALLSSVGPGSILFTGINSSDPDRFAFVAMQELPGSMAITFTDNAWTGSALANSEGKLVYTTPAAGLAAGSRVVIERGSGGNSATVLSGGGSVGVPDAAFSLDPAGDNLFACMGTSPNPTFLAGALTAVPLTAGATSTSQTYVPSAIAEATVYLVASGGVANAAYAGSTTGVKALVAASLVDPADWAMSAAAPIPDGSAFVFIESQVEQAVAFSALPAKTYGDASFALSAAASSGLPVRYESSDTSVASVSGNMLTVLRAGSATISAAQPGNPQYAAAAPVQRTLAVSPKALSITADAKSKTYGQADPALTYSSSGLLGQDAIAGSLSRELGENAGAYAIAQGSLTAGADYSISFTGANLTVSAAPLPEIGWGGAEVANAGSVASFSYAYTGRSSGGVSTSFSGSTPPASAGYYTAIATSTDSNYAGSSTNSFFVSGPVAADDAVSRPTATMNIPKATLLQNDLRIDSSGALQTNGLTITAVAAGAGSPTVSLNGAFVSFAPSSQTGAETFTYTLGDGIKTATATVTVTPYADLSNDPFGITGTSRGSHIGAAAYDSGTGMTEIPVTFSGTPNVTYWVQYTGEIGQPWKNAGGWFSENGTFQVTIQEQGNHAADWNGSMFFRATR